MKTIIPYKIVLECTEEGDFKNGIIIYQVKSDNGELDMKYKTISIRSVIGTAAMNILIKNAMNHAQIQETIKHV